MLYLQKNHPLKSTDTVNLSQDKHLLNYLQKPPGQTLYKTVDISNISALLNLQKTCDIRFISAIMGAKTIPTIFPPIISGDYGWEKGKKVRIDRWNPSCSGLESYNFMDVP